MSPSPGSQNHNFNATNMSNGYASPMSTGSYDPYSPNGKIGKYKTLYKYFYFHLKIYILNYLTCDEECQSRSVSSQILCQEINFLFKFLL